MRFKLGIHQLRPAGAEHYIQTAKPTVVKFVNDFGLSEWASQYSLVIGRGYTDQTLLQQYEQYPNDPARAAEEFVDAQYNEYYKLNPQVKIWEGHNEPSFGGPNDQDAIAKMAWYGFYEAERCRLLAVVGLRAVIGNFSTGYPEITETDLRMWTAFQPAIEAVKFYNGFLGLHEYAAPWMWWLTGEYQIRNCNDVSKWAFPAGPVGQRGFLTLRYRMVYDYVLKPQGLVVPLIITECGNDRAGGGCSNIVMPAEAWKRLTEWWKGWTGSADPIEYWMGTERDPEKYYALQLAWYEERLREDDYVIGATVFTFGHDNPVWEPFDIAGTRVPGYLIEEALKVHQIPAISELLPHEWAVDDVGSFWEWIQEQQHHLPGEYDSAKDHREAIINYWKPRNTKGNFGLGAVDIIKPGGRLDFDWYDRVLFGDERGRGLTQAGLKLAVMMLDTIPSHMNVGGWYGKAHEAEMRIAFEGIVNHLKHINKRWTFGNELDHNALTPLHYAWSLKVFCEAVAKADPSAEVALSMPLSQFDSADHSTPWTKNVLDALKATGGVPSNLKGMNTHPYTDNHNDVAINKQLFDSLRAFSDLDFWVLEYGKSKDKLLPNWNTTGSGNLLKVQQLQRDRFVEAYQWLTTGPHANRTKIICYHRLFDVPQTSYGMVSIGVWNGTEALPFLIEKTSRDMYADAMLPIDPPDLPIGENMIRNPKFLETEVIEGQVIHWPVEQLGLMGISGRIVGPWKVLWYATRDTPQVDVNPGTMPWNTPEIIDLDQKPDLPPIPAGGRMLKGFLGSSPNWWVVGEEVAITEPGTYRLISSILPDPVISYSPKVHPSPASSGDWYLGAEFYSGLKNLPAAALRPQDWLYLNGLSPMMTFGQWNEHLSETFTVTAPGIFLALFSFRFRWGFKSAGGFVTNVRLQKIGGQVDPPPPDELPDITPELSAIKLLTQEIEFRNNQIKQQVSSIEAKMQG
jgi:hypothetical protein